MRELPEEVKKKVVELRKQFDEQVEAYSKWGHAGNNPEYFAREPKMEAYRLLQEQGLDLSEVVDYFASLGNPKNNFAKTLDF